jgi:pimeloyl-ACP methyl ester carboxylesterase
VPVLFVHGNVASSLFFEETLAALPPYYRGLAPDLRGFGRSEPKPVDATRGMRDLSDDLYELMKALGYAEDRKVHLVGWSLGGGVVMQYAIDHPQEVASLTLSCPIPPFGMGGTKDICGTPCWPDYAGSGGGLVNLDFVRFLEQGLADDSQNAHNPSSSQRDEHDLLQASLSARPRTRGDLGLGDTEDEGRRLQLPRGQVTLTELA